MRPPKDVSTLVKIVNRSPVLTPAQAQGKFYLLLTYRVSHIEMNESKWLWGGRWIGNFVQLECLKSLIEEHARLGFSDFLSTLLAIYHVINEKFPLLVY